MTLLFKLMLVDEHKRKLENQMQLLIRVFLRQYERYMTNTHIVKLENLQFYIIYKTYKIGTY